MNEVWYDEEHHSHPHCERRLAQPDASATLVVAHVDNRIRHVARVHTMVVTFLPA